MSVLIKGMTRPKNCFECHLTKWIDDGQARCVADDKIHNASKPVDCPLAEVPEPHGDLIDRDALVKDLTNGIKAGLLLDGYEKYQNINNMDDCVECAKYADAVIEAEGSENHDD